MPRLIHHGLIALVSAISCDAFTGGNIWNNDESNSHLRSSSRKLQLFGSVPDFVCDLFPLFCSEPENCPRVRPLDSDQYDLDVYIEKSWYIQKQQLVQYQPTVNNLYCVVATYDRRSDGLIQVNNYADTNRVNAGDSETNEGENDFGLCARQLGAGELKVGPCLLGIDPLPTFIFDLLAGPYWVIALSDPGTDNYEWAIVSGGAPDIVKQEDPPLCTTSNGLLYTDAILGSGVFLLSRDPVANETIIQEMMDELDRLGIYTGELKDVTQEGCNYNRAYIKS